jgi:serine protease AprX
MNMFCIKPRPVFACLLCVLMFTPVVLTQQAWEDKVVDFVLEHQSNPDNEFFVYLSEQADLSPAESMAYKNEKGQFVYETLTNVASRTQPAVIETLEALDAEYQSFWVANMILVRGGDDVLAKMARREDVAMIYGNPRGRVVDYSERDAGESAVPPGRSIEWNIERINAPDVWAQGVTGQGVVVAHIDLGVMWDHPALINQYRGWDGVTANHNYNWYDTMGACMAPCDEYSHGTRTIGIMVGDDGGENQIGVAPGAKWIAVRISPTAPTLADLLNAFEWLMAPRDLFGMNPDPAKAPHIVCNCWGCDAGWGGCSDVLVLLPALSSMRQAGIIPVAIAHNDGPTCSTISYAPCIYAENLTVGGTNYVDGIQSWSSRGPVLSDGSGRIKPDVCAPSYVRSSTNTGAYSMLGGTSSAGPHVAGLAALLISANNSLSGNVDVIEAIIRLTAIPKTTVEECGGVPGSEIPNNTYGYGLIDALAAYDLAMDPSDVPEVTLYPIKQSIKVAPNPGVNGSRITYQLGYPSLVSLRIVDLTGRKVRTLLNRIPLDPGDHASTWDGCDEHGQKVAAGVYMYQLRTGEETNTGRLILVE